MMVSVSLYHQAAAMWELGSQFEKALAIHVASKNMTAAAKIASKVTQPKLLGKCRRDCTS